MELVIIALIAVEVIIVCLTIYHWFDVTDSSNQALIRDGPELWQMLVGSQESKKNQDKLVAAQ